MIIEMCIDMRMRIRAFARGERACARAHERVCGETPHLSLLSPRATPTAMAAVSEMGRGSGASGSSPLISVSTSGPCGRVRAYRPASA